MKPLLSGENSVILSLATAALVGGIYSQKIGPVADVHATNANDRNYGAAIRKAGFESATLVAAMWLLAGMDHNIAILGGATIIAEELAYRHANMTDPASGQIQVTPASYEAATTGATVTPISAAAG